MRIEDYEKIVFRAADNRLAGYTTKMPSLLRDLFFQGVPVKSSDELGVINSNAPNVSVCDLDVAARDRTE